MPSGNQLTASSRSLARTKGPRSRQTNNGYSRALPAQRLPLGGLLVGPSVTKARREQPRASLGSSNFAPRASGYTPTFPLMPFQIIAAKWGRRGPLNLRGRDQHRSFIIAHCTCLSENARTTASTDPRLPLERHHRFLHFRQMTYCLPLDSFIGFAFSTVSLSPAYWDRHTFVERYLVHLASFSPLSRGGRGPRTVHGRQWTRNQLPSTPCVLHPPLGAQGRTPNRQRWVEQALDLGHQTPETQRRPGYI